MPMSTRKFPYSLPLTTSIIRSDSSSFRRRAERYVSACSSVRPNSSGKLSWRGGPMKEVRVSGSAMMPCCRRA